MDNQDVIVKHDDSYYLYIAYGVKPCNLKDILQNSPSIKTMDFSGAPTLYIDKIGAEDTSTGASRVLYTGHVDENHVDVDILYNYLIITGMKMLSNDGALKISGTAASLEVLRDQLVALCASSNYRLEVPKALKIYDTGTDIHEKWEQEYLCVPALDHVTAKLLKDDTDAVDAISYTVKSHPINIKTALTDMDLSGHLHCSGISDIVQAPAFDELHFSGPDMTIDSIAYNRVSPYYVCRSLNIESIKEDGSYQSYLKDCVGAAYIIEIKSGIVFKFKKELGREELYLYNCRFIDLAKGEPQCLSKP